LSGGTSLPSDAAPCQAALMGKDKTTHQVNTTPNSAKRRCKPTHNWCSRGLYSMRNFLPFLICQFMECDNLTLRETVIQSLAILPGKTLVSGETLILLRHK
jgi:hypothetical protein